MTDHPYQINIVSTDISFARILTLEAERMDLEVTVSSAPSDGYTVYIIDLDHSSPVTKHPKGYTIWFSQEESGACQVPKSSRYAFLLRPFSMKEFRALLIRIFVSIETKKRRVEQASPSPSLVLDRENRTLSVDYCPPIPLTEAEYGIMTGLSEKRGQPFGKEEASLLLKSEGVSNCLEVHICSLRKKIAAYTDKKLIHTLRGQGYYIK